MSATTPDLPPFPPPVQQDETMWAVFAQVSGLVGLGLIGPLVIMLVCADQRPFAKAHATEALNFHITVLFGVVISLVLFFVETFRYPLTLRLVT